MSERGEDCYKINKIYILAKNFSGGVKIPEYVVLSRLTDEGRKTLKENPTRIEEVNREIEDMGADILDQFAVFGEYDFVNILDVPDARTMIKISVEIGSRGSVKLETLPAMRIEELIESI